MSLKRANRTRKRNGKRSRKMKETRRKGGREGRKERREKKEHLITPLIFGYSRNLAKPVAGWQGIEGTGRVEKDMFN